jgi:hypothetical protein
MPTQTNSWFDQGEGMPPALPGNEVTYLIDGEDAFREIVAAMRRANSPGDFRKFSASLPRAGSYRFAGEWTSRKTG